MEKLEADLRDHLIAATQDKDYSEDELHGMALSFVKNWALYGDGYEDRAGANGQSSIGASVGEVQPEQQTDGGMRGAEERADPLADPRGDADNNIIAVSALGGDHASTNRPAHQSYVMGGSASITPNGAPVATSSMAEQGATAPTNGDSKKMGRDEQKEGDGKDKELLGLVAKLPEQECASLERDIGLEKGTIEKLQRMMKEGKDFKDYGLVPHADSNGYVSEISGTKSQTYQRLLRALEGDAKQTSSDKIDRVMATLASGSYNKGSALVEKNRSGKMLKDMEDAFLNQCKK